MRWCGQRTNSSMYSKQEFVQIFVPHRRAVLALCQRMLGHSEEAEDACQAVYLALWEQRDRLPDVGNALAYVIRTARNYCLSRLRRVDYTEPLSEQLAEAVTDAEEAEQRAREDEMLQKLSVWAQGLPEPQRTIFASVYYRGERAEQVAHSVGLSHGNVRVILTRLRKAAQQYLTTIDND